MEGGGGGGGVTLLEYCNVATSLNYLSVGGGSSIYHNVQCKHILVCPGGGA